MAKFGALCFLRELFSNVKIGIFFIASVSLLNASAISASELAPVLIDKPELNLGKQLQYWATPDDTISLESIQTVADTQWKTSESSTPNFGFTNLSYWFRAEVSNTTNDESDYLLEFAYPVLDLIDLTLIYSNAKTMHYLMGDSLPFSSRPIAHRNFLIPLHITKGESLKLYFKIKTAGALQVPLTIYERADFSSNDQYDLLAIGAYFGIVLIMIFYNLFIYFAVRDKSYIFYVFSVGSLSFLQLALHGVGFEIVWPHLYKFNDYAVPLAISSGSFFTCIFSISFLQLKTISRKTYLFYQGVTLFSLLCVVAGFFLPYNSICQIDVALGIVSSTSCLFTGWVLWIKGHRHARYYALAWTAVLAFTCVLGLNKFGILPRNLFTEYAVQAGGILEAVLLSFALADRINSEKRAKFSVQEQALGLEKRARFEQERALRLEISAKEEQLRYRELVVEAENRAKSQFIMIMSHELRTPLNGILGLASLLKDPKLGQEQHDHYLDVINISGHSLLNILQSILDYSRLNSDQIESGFEDINIQQICNEVIQLFIPITEKKALPLTLEFAKGTPLWVRSDGARLRQVLLNLVGNADKFTDKGQIQIIVSHYENWLRFEVHDSGAGIAQEKLDELFQPFNQADVSTTRRFGGAGMGLSLCKRLVNVLGGEIGVHSEINKGSVFWFTIPFKAVQSNPNTKLNELDTLQQLEAIDWQNRNALIVEDNAVNRMVVIGMLKKIGLHYDIAEDGAQALDKFTRPNVHFDVVLMDCDMPVMDGYTATEKIRQWEQQHHKITTPILALTAQVAPEHVTKALESGMNAHLGKPITSHQLEHALARHLPNLMLNRKSV